MRSQHMSSPCSPPHHRNAAFLAPPNPPIPKRPISPHSDLNPSPKRNKFSECGDTEPFRSPPRSVHGSPFSVPSSVGSPLNGLGTPFYVTHEALEVALLGEGGESKGPPRARRSLKSFFENDSNPKPNICTQNSSAAQVNVDRNSENLIKKKGSLERNEDAEEAPRSSWEAMAAILLSRRELMEASGGVREEASGKDKLGEAREEASGKEACVAIERQVEALGEINRILRQCRWKEAERDKNLYGRKVPRGVGIADLKKERMLMLQNVSRVMHYLHSGGRGVDKTPAAGRRSEGEREWERVRVGKEEEEEEELLACEEEGLDDWEEDEEEED